MRQRHIPLPVRLAGFERRGIKRKEGKNVPDVKGTDDSGCGHRSNCGTYRDFVTDHSLGY